jgi:hypothetical protein
MTDDQTASTDVRCEPQLVRALCSKYEKLCDLRQRQLSSVAPRAEMVALSAAFPGALRELDGLPWEELERRMLALRDVVEGRAQLEQWMQLQIAYHGFMRAVLRIRRQLLEIERSGSELQYAAAADEPARERFDAVALATIRKPPLGRLNPWVLDQVARDHAVSRTCIEDALWGKRSARP